MNTRLKDLNTRLDTLTIFRALLEDPVFRKLQYLLDECSRDADGEDPDDLMNAAVAAYCDFTYELYSCTPDLSDYVLKAVTSDENFYMEACAFGKEIPAVIEDSLKRELDILNETAALTSREIKNSIDYSGELPDWNNSDVDITGEYKAKIEQIPYCGFGMYSRYHMFTIQNGFITPVKHPDKQRLEDLIGYLRERELVVRNTEVLLAGNPASNVLLYGDAGTGKSSTVKAIANKYKDRGLRLIEIKKNQLYMISDIIEELSQNPLKFILFIDDLSFMANDDNFSALKAVLEGSVTAPSSNIAIYATSNRRHLVKETLADRGDEIHASESLQETTSLAARFGLTVVFQQPEREEYLQIVHQLAETYNIVMPQPLLDKDAETYAIRNGGRSPRAAKHFIELLRAGIQGGQIDDEYRYWEKPNG